MSIFMSEEEQSSLNEARQARLGYLGSSTAIKKQLNRRLARLALHQTRRLINAEGKLNDCMSLNEPLCQL